MNVPKMSNTPSDPWENRNKSPPELDDFLKKIIRQASSYLPGGSPINFSLIILLVISFLAIWSTFYTVPSDSIAVIQRFGLYVRESSPGLHLKFPLGIETIKIVPIKRQLKQEFGFSTPNASDPFQSPPIINGVKETQMVTGDLNAALIEWVVQYRISEPVKFLFEVRKPRETLRYVSESVMREVIGDRTVDEVITVGRQDIEFDALVKMQELSTKYTMGISIDQVQLKNINPPTPVQESFNEVNQAQQEKERLINDARRDYNKIIPLALGEKDQRIREADGYRIQRINEAEGDIIKFNHLFTQYLKAPEVTKRRIYIESIQKALSNTEKKIIIDKNTSNIVVPSWVLSNQPGEKP